MRRERSWTGAVASAVPMPARAAFRLLHFRGLLLGTAAAGLVLVGFMTTTRVWQAAAEDTAFRAAVRQAQHRPLLTLSAYGRIGARTPWQPSGRTLDELTGMVRAIADRTAARLDEPPAGGLGMIRLSLQSAALTVKGPGGEAATTLGTLDGAERVIGAAAEPGSGGVWLDQTTAARLRVGRGDRLGLESDGRTATVRVDGIHADLDPRRADLPETLRPVADRHPVLASEATVKAAADDLGLIGKATWWIALDPARAGTLGVPEAERLARAIGALDGIAQDPASDLAQGIGSVATVVDTGPLLAATGIRAGLSPPMRTISLAGQVLALALVVLAAGYTVGRRRVELAILHAHGVRRAALGARLAGEALLPLALGGAAGWAAAVWGVALLRPDAGFPREVTTAAARDGVGLLAAGVVTFGLAAWVSLRRELPEQPTRSRRRWPRARRLPWELAVLGLAAAATYELLGRGSLVIAEATGAPRVDGLLVLFPVLVLGGVAGIATRGIERLLTSGPARRSTFGVRRSPVAFLAARRLSTAPRAAFLLVTLIAVALGLLGYGAAAAGSVRAAMLGKASVQQGAEVVVPSRGPATGEARARLASAAPATEVLVAKAGAPLALGPDGDAAFPRTELTDLLAVDPATIGGVVGWNPAWSNVPLDELLSRLRGPAGEPRRGLPTILVDPDYPLDLRPDGRIVWSRGIVRGARGQEYVEQVIEQSIPLEVVGVARDFPGAPKSTPRLLVVPRDLLAAEAGGRMPLASQVWGRGDAGGVLDAMRTAGIAAAGPARTAADLAATPAYASVDWTFGLLQGLGLLAVSVSLCALVLYAHARQKAQTVTYALVRRMGLGRWAHQSAMALELTALLGMAYLVGAAVAMAAAALVIPRLDPLPARAPGLRLLLPLPELGLVGGGLVVLAWLAALLLQRRADRADVAEVMRLAG